MTFPQFWLKVNRLQPVTLTHSFYSQLPVGGLNERSGNMNSNRFNFNADSLGAQPLNPSDSLRGQLLVSTERLNGTRFEKSVILLM